MQVKTTLSISEARKQLFTIASKVQQSGAYYTLTERGKPTVVMISANFFESLQQKQIGSMLESNNAWMVREVSPQQYRVAKEAFKEKDLLRSQLFVALTERYGYPFGSIDIGRWIPKGESGSRTFIESDLLVDEKDGGALIICAVETFQHYEAHTQRTLEELFEIVATFAKKSYQSRFIVYATRTPASVGGKSTARQDKWTLVDVQKYPSFKAWQQAGSPLEKSLPKHPSFGH
jgi:prevent-host-death family protein